MDHEKLGAEVEGGADTNVLQKLVEGLQQACDLNKEITGLNEEITDCTCKNMSCTCCAEANARLLVLKPLEAETMARVLVLESLAGVHPSDSEEALIEDQNSLKDLDKNLGKKHRKSRKKR